MTVKSVIQPGAKMKACLAQYAHGQYALAAILQGEFKLTAQQALIARIKCQSRIDATHAFATTIGIFKAALYFFMLPAFTGIQQIVLMKAIVTAIRRAKRTVQSRPPAASTALRNGNRVFIGRSLTSPTACGWISVPGFVLQLERKRPSTNL